MTAATSPPLLGDIRAVVFDYGNTLIPFTHEQLEHIDHQLASALEQRFGTVDIDRLRAIRDMNRTAPYSGEFRENDFAEITVELVRELFRTEPTPDQLAELMDIRFHAFVNAVTYPHYLHDLLPRLKRRYKLGLLSNYPCGRAIRATLERGSLTAYFDAVVVSADVGHVKPHPLPFRTILGQLDVPPHHAVYIGDNWLGDVQGAKRAGMRCIYLTQYDTPEKFPREPGHVDPDLCLDNLTHLEAHLA